MPDPRRWFQRKLRRDADRETPAKQPNGVREFSAEDVERMRREMREQFAPATELPVIARKPRRSGTVVDGDLI